MRTLSGRDGGALLTSKAFEKLRGGCLVGAIDGKATQFATYRSAKSLRNMVDALGLEPRTR